MSLLSTLIEKATDLIDTAAIKEKLLAEGTDAARTFLMEKGMSPDTADHLIGMVQGAITDSETGETPAA